MSATLKHVAYLAGFRCEPLPKYRALLDLALSLSWGALAYWQCGKSWMLFGVALLGCWVRLEKALQ